MLFGSLVSCSTFAVIKLLVGMNSNGGLACSQTGEIQLFRQRRRRVSLIYTVRGLRVLSNVVDRCRIRRIQKIPKMGGYSLRGADSRREINISFHAFGAASSRYCKNGLL